MKHIGTKTIETTRLLLRKLELSDADMMFQNWTSDDKVTLFLRWNAHKTIDQARNMISKVNWAIRLVVVGGIKAIQAKQQGRLLITCFVIQI